MQSTHSIDFCFIIPNIDIRMHKGLIHTYPSLRVNHQHPWQQVPCLARWEDVPHGAHGQMRRNQGRKAKRKNSGEMKDRVSSAGWWKWRNKKGYKVTRKKRENKKIKLEISVGEIRWSVRGGAKENKAHISNFHIHYTFTKHFI